MSHFAEICPPPCALLTSQAQVLVSLARNPDATLREVAAEIGITERSVQRIISELKEAGVIRKGDGERENRYLICWETLARSTDPLLELALHIRESGYARFGTLIPPEPFYTDEDNWGRTGSTGPV